MDAPRWSIFNINKQWWQAAKRGQIVRNVDPALYLGSNPPLYLDFFEVMNIHCDNISRDQDPYFPLAYLFWVIAIGVWIALIFDLTAAWTVSAQPMGTYIATQAQIAVLKPFRILCHRSTSDTKNSGTSNNRQLRRCCTFPFSLLAGVLAPGFTMVSLCLFTIFVHIARRVSP